MSLPATMPAMVTMGHGDMDQLVWQTDWPRPEPAAGKVLINVRACGLNNTDVNTRVGWYSKSVTGATTGEVDQTPAEEDPSWGRAATQFPRIQGAEPLKRVPKPYDQDHPHAELLKKKSMVLNAPLGQDWRQSEGGLLSAVRDRLETVQPLRDFLNEKLSAGG